MSFLRNLFVNPVKAMAEGAVMPTVLFALMTGVAMAQRGSQAHALRELMSEALEIILMIVNGIMKVAPFSIRLVGTSGSHPVLRTLRPPCPVHRSGRWRPADSWAGLVASAAVSGVRVSAGEIFWSRPGSHHHRICHMLQLSHIARHVEDRPREPPHFSAHRQVCATAWRHHEYGRHRPL